VKGRGYFVVLLVLMLSSTFAQDAAAQSTLNFPRAFTPPDLGSTGFAVVNPGSSSASATFTLRGTDGATLATDARTVAAGGQLAKLGSELFPGASDSGWIQLTSDSTGLQGFWLGGDFTTFTDGAEAAPSASDLIFPLVASDTEVNIANTAGTPVAVTISLRQADGTELGSATQTIAGMGLFQSAASTLFSGADLTQATHVRMTAETSISATAIVNGFLVSPSWGAVNGVDAEGTATELNFAHVISGAGGGGNWLTQIGVTNLMSSSNNVTITFNPLSGSSTSVQRTIAANGSLRESAETLFSFPSSEFQDGWVQVTGSPAITGFVAYADSTAGGLAIVPAQQSALTEMVFAHIAQQTGWLTGVALLNTSATTADVEIYAMNPDGTLIGGAQDSPAAAFTLAPGTKIAKLLNDPWIPNAQTNGGFVFVRTTNSVPLFGIELFFLSNLALLSNVAPGALATGITYTPPAPVGTITLDSLSPATISRGSALTLNGGGFNATSANNTIVFTSAGGTTSVAADTATATTLTVTVPGTAISGPVLVQSGGASSSSQILAVTASSTELVQSSVTVAAGQTTSGIDIYVPTPAGSLNVTAIGAGDRFSGISFAARSVELTRGQVTDLIISGTGISQANESTLTVSGDGLAFANISFTGNNMFVAVSVSANAALGPRTVIVTNSNLDTSVLSGGIIVRQREAF
jgi:hypothetical protein